LDGESTAGHHGGRRIESVPERVHPIHAVPIRRRTRRPLQVVFRAIGAPTQNPPRAGAIGSSRALGGKVPPGYVVDKRNTDGTITHPLLVRLRYLALVIHSEFSCTRDFRSPFTCGSLIGVSRDRVFVPNSILRYQRRCLYIDATGRATSPLWLPKLYVSSAPQRQIASCFGDKGQRSSSPYFRALRN
jgi:hypothetical protein